MHYTYNISFEDVMELEKMSVMKNEYIKRLRWLLPILFILITLIGGLYSTVFGWIISGILIALWIILNPALLYKLQLNRSRTILWKHNTSFFTGKRVMEMKDDGFTVTSDFSVQFFKWEAVTQFEESSNSIFIRVGVNYWFIVTFHDNENLEQNRMFYGQLKSRLKGIMHG